MKKRILKSSNALLAAILALFGISSCEDGGIAEYGVETSDFVIVGTITNEESAPIKDIQVVRHPGFDTAFTDANGNFRIVNEGFQGGYVLLHIDDVDGDANGSYQSDTAQVILTRNAQGFLGANINKTLKEKTE
ncbi:MAG: radical SAM-associated putative lipoprotein [Bacteroidales bacterium]|nr:radical SAM-associated putative lipoprotein [Bacteroidales bacterium]